MSPNARSKALLEADGLTVEIVERWVPGANIRRDLFGLLDLLAIGDGQTLGIQATTSDHLADRRRKLYASPLLARLFAAGWRIEVHAWQKRKGRWLCKREVISAKENPQPYESTGGLIE